MKRIFLVLMLFSCAAACAQDQDEQGAEQKAESDPAAVKRIEYMKESVAGYDFRMGPDFERKLTLEPEPLLRFTNPVSGLKDGVFVLWKDEGGRPMVGAQVFLTADDIWLHEFQSLAPVALKATRDGSIRWAPDRAGAERKTVPGAPVPADSAVQRLVQMRNIAKRFTASDEFEGRERSDVLRLLVKPLVRFSNQQGGILDGALFAHAHGTDPELLILVEAMKTDSGYEWNYSLAPMTGYALKASLDDQPVWEVEWRKGPYQPTEPFAVLIYRQKTALQRILDLSP